MISVESVNMELEEEEGEAMRAGDLDEEGDDVSYKLHSSTCTSTLLHYTSVLLSPALRSHGITSAFVNRTLPSTTSCIAVILLFNAVLVYAHLSCPHSILVTPAMGVATGVFISNFPHLGGPEQATCIQMMSSFN
jgi:hypothetical protein